MKWECYRVLRQSQKFHKEIECATSKPINETVGLARKISETLEPLKKTHPIIYQILQYRSLGHTFEEIGKIMRMSRENVRQKYMLGCNILKEFFVTQNK